MKVLITGGRDYPDRSHVFDILDRLHEAVPIARDGGAYQRALDEARAERRALLAVIRMLDGKPTPATLQAGDGREP